MEWEYRRTWKIRKKEKERERIRINITCRLIAAVYNIDYKKSFVLSVHWCSTASILMESMNFA